MAPLEEPPVLKNLHTRLFFVILALTAISAYVVATRPARLGLDIQGGMRVVLRAQKEKLNTKETWDAEKLETVRKVIDNRVNALGVAEPNVYTKPAEDRIVVELPGLKNREEALAIIKSTAMLEFRSVPELDNGTWDIQPDTSARGKGETGYSKIVDSTGKEISAQELEDRVFSKEPFLSGAKLKPNSRADIGTGKPIIHFEFQDDAKGTFEEYTRSHIGKSLAIFLDRKLISAPRINDVIPGTGIIEGNFTAESAKRLADMLNAGALPVPLEQEELSFVEATLGKRAMQQTLVAGIVGLGLVLLIMMWWYKVPGLLADLALILYTLFSLALFYVIPVTLTVPGIAGFILSIGMAVDANILIFERMREERAAGKTVRASIEIGFKRAFNAIADSNICTLITCAILYNFGTGPVRGFAVTLAIGVAVSMFTAITVSRTFVMMFADSRAGQNDKLYAFEPRKPWNLRVTRRNNLWLAISAALLIPGMIFWAMGGVKKSIEFTGGTELSVQFAGPASASSIRSALQGVGINESRVIMAEGNRAFITTERMESQEERDAAISALDKAAPIATTAGSKAVSVSEVSGAISKELAWNAIQAVALASLLIVLYLAARFSIPNLREGLKFGLCAVAALIHDAGVLWGSFAFLGYFLNWQIDSLFVTAMLTVIGFSVHDTIVIFDRIRENLRRRQRGETFEDVADKSINETMVRSVRTGGATILTLLALLLLGGPTVRQVVAALLIGILSGTYSSIFNATPLLVLWKRRGGEAAMSPVTGGSARPARPSAQPTARPQTASSGPRLATATGDGGGSATLAEGGDGSEGRTTRAAPRKIKRRRM
jgi:SecD/SecF fusion protein